MLLVPFEARFIVLGKRVDALEGRLLILCLTDQQLGKTLMEQVIYNFIVFFYFIFLKHIFIVKRVILGTLC